MAWALLASTAVSAGGAFLSSQANKSAAAQANAGLQAGAAANQQWTQQAQAQLGRVAQDNAGGQNYLKGVVAGSGDLTPAQQKALEDIRRNTTNEIRSSSLAGSGRSSAAVLNDQENRFTLGALDQNRNKAIDAANGMAQRAYGAQTGAAGLSTDIGKGYMAADQQGGLIDAGATLANGKLFGSAIGNIGSSIAKSGKGLSGIFGGGGGGDMPSAGKAEFA